MFYGHYRSSSTGTTGCPKEFLTTPKDQMAFPPSVSYYCDLCGTHHAFRLYRGHMAATPRQVDQLRFYADNAGIERDVEL